MVTEQQEVTEEGGTVDGGDEEQWTWDKEGHR